MIKNKMTLLEIRDERTRLLDANDAITSQSKADNRAKTEGELATMQTNLRRLKELDVEEETEKYRAPEGSQVRSAAVKYAKPKETFSLIRAIRDRVENRAFNDATKEFVMSGRREFQRAGVTSGGDIVMPCEFRAPIDAGVTGATHGIEIVSEEKKSILPPLADKLVLAKAGCTMMTGLVGDVSIPSYSGTTVDWKGENTIAVDGGGTFKEVNFTPKRLTAYIDVSKLFLAQDGVGAERLLLDNIAEAVARKLESTIFGKLTYSATVPSGIGFKLDAVPQLTGATFTYAAIVGLEAAVEASNALQGSLCYITSGKGRGMLKSKDKGVSNDTGDMMCSEDNMVNGYPLLVTNSIANTYGNTDTGTMVCFGNWRDLCIAQWGGYDITVDPYTLATTNQVRITINAFFDAKGLRGNWATTDEYAYSFAALSIV
jgi:HK97 family phage major capsid protein